MAKPRIFVFTPKRRRRRPFTPIIPPSPRVIPSAETVPERRSGRDPRANSRQRRADAVQKEISIALDEGKQEQSDILDTIAETATGFGLSLLRLNHQSDLGQTVGTALGWTFEDRAVDFTAAATTSILYQIDATLQAIVVTLPPAAGNAGLEIGLLSLVTVNTITVVAAGADMIFIGGVEGPAFGMGTAGAFYVLLSNGTRWLAMQLY